MHCTSCALEMVGVQFFTSTSAFPDFRRPKDVSTGRAADHHLQKKADLSVLVNTF